MYIIWTFFYIYVGLRLEKAQPLISLYQFCHSNNMRDNDAGDLPYILIIMSIMCLVCMALPTDATAVSSISLGNRKVYLKFVSATFVHLGASSVVIAAQTKIFVTRQGNSASRFALCATLYVRQHHLLLER